MMLARLPLDAIRQMDQLMGDCYLDALRQQVWLDEDQMAKVNDLVVILCLIIVRGCRMDMSMVVSRTGGHLRVRANDAQRIGLPRLLRLRAKAWERQLYASHVPCRYRLSE